MGASEDVLDFLDAVGGEISDHRGRITPIIAQAMPYPGSQASLSSLLHNLEKRGLITRDIRQRRTYAIKLSAPKPPPAADALHTPSDVWAAERAIYSAAIGRARERINDFEEQLVRASADTSEALQRADKLQEQLAMAERTIDSMRTQLLDARKQMDLFRRTGADRRPTSPAVGATRASAGAEWDRLMRERPDR